MREFRQQNSRSSETRYRQTWIDDIDPNRFWTAWGAIKPDGKRKEHGRTSDVPGSKGKKGTKAFVSAEANAEFKMNVGIRKKLEEGYIEVGLDGRPLVGGSADEIDHAKPLPKNLCFSKPRNEINDKKLAKWIAADKLIYTRKAQGMAVVVHIMADGEVRIYSRRMDDITGHFPQLVRGLQDKYPPCSILLFEGIMLEGNTYRDFKVCASVMRSKEDKALRRQEELGPMKFYLYRVPVWDGRWMEHDFTAAQMLDFIEEIFADDFAENMDEEHKVRILYCVELFEGSIEEAMEYCIEQDYEGWVVYVGEDKLGDQSFTFNGKPSRPPGCFKLKPDHEDDFIALFDPKKEYEARCSKNCILTAKQMQEKKKCPVCGAKMIGLGKAGTGKHRGGMGTVSLFQMNKNGEKIYICEVGIFKNFPDEYKMENADPADYPKVLQVIYDARQYISQGDDTNALILPRVVAEREDKDVFECVNPEL